MVNRNQNYLPDNMVGVTTNDGHDDESAALRARLARFDTMQSFWSAIHAEGNEDDAFVAGEQWPAHVRKEREEEGRPVLTYNLLPAFTRQIINKVRQELPQLRVKPVESDRNQTPDVSNVQGTQDYSLADVFMGLIRNIEHVSRASQAYEKAITDAVHHGFGYITLNTRYSRHDPFIQELVIERVKDSYGVYIDPSAHRADFSDAQDAFIFTSMRRAAFEAKYPDANIGEFNTGITAGLHEDWFDSDSVKIATYYWIDWQDDEVVKMNDGKVHYFSDIKDVLDEMMEKSGIYIARENGEELRRKVKRPVCKWQKMTGSEFLTEETSTPFENIPIFPVLGDEFILDGRTMYGSAIRDARDAQRSYNYWRTAAAEAVALAPKAPFVLTAKQIDGHEKLWETANRSNMPYLVYNHMDGQPPPQRMGGANPAAAELANATQDSADIQAIIGLHDASLGRESNEKSGKAILARQAQGSTSTFTFPANLNRAIEAMGRVMVQAIPRIYDTSRVVRVRMPDDTEDFVELNKMEIDEQTRKAVLVHDIAYGKYDVVVETGPSYATQRQESVEAMLELLSTLPPDLVPSIVHLAVKNMGFPGSDEIAAILRKNLPDHLKSEDDRAADLPKGVVFDESGQPVTEATGQPWSPPLTEAQKVQQQTNAIEQEKVKAEMAKAEAEMAKAEADKAQAEAKIAKAQADIEQTKLDAAQLGQPDTNETPAEPAFDSDAILKEIEGIIKQAFEEHEANPKAHQVPIEEIVAETMVEMLQRVKRYVDGQTTEISSAPMGAKVTDLTPNP